MDRSKDGKDGKDGWIERLIGGTDGQIDNRWMDRLKDGTDE